MFQGQLDTPLDDLGRSQAEAVAPVLATLEPAVLLTSDLSRARATVAPLERATGTTALADRRLRELDLGAWQGLTAPVALERFPDEHAAWRSGVDVARGGGETYRQAGERAVACLLDHLPGVAAGEVLTAVTHGGTARAVMGLLLTLPDASWSRLAPLGNCCWSVLAEHPHGWRLEQHGSGLGLPLTAPAPLRSTDQPVGQPVGAADGRPL